MKYLKANEQQFYKIIAFFKWTFNYIKKNLGI